MIRTFKMAATGFVLVSAVAQAYSTPQGSYMQGQQGTYQSYPIQQQGYYQGDVYSTPSYPQGYSTQAPIQQQYEVYDGRAAVRPSYNWGGDSQRPLDQRIEMQRGSDSRPLDQRIDMQNQRWGGDSQFRSQDQRLDMQNQRNLNQRSNLPENRNINQPQQFRSDGRRLLADSNQMDTDSRQMNARQQMNSRDMDSSTNDDAFKVRRALQNDTTLSINARNIRVALNADNQLILTGNVRDEAERKRVEEIAKKSTGIQNVINKLTIARD